MRSIITLCVMLLVFPIAQAQTSGNDQFDLLIGTYANAAKTNGIHVYRFDAATGDATPLTVNTQVSNPSYLAPGADGRYVYAVSEEGQGNGKVYAFSFNPSTGSLAMINSVSSSGDHPCYVSVDRQNKLVLVGNYSSGTLSAIPAGRDGSLGDGAQTIQHKGSSVDESRQDAPHVHAVVLSPDERFLFVPDLGTDRVNIYEVDPSASTPLTAAGKPYAEAPAGSGPRHFTFHPNGSTAYLVQELDATVTVFDYRKGTLAPVQAISMLAPGFNGNVGAADIHVSPDGNFLYASNRGDANDIAIYAIDKKGILTYVGRQSTLGKTPRNFVIDPTGSFLLAANQNSNDVVIFRRDTKTGLLTDTGKRIRVDKPVCLKFVRVRP